MIYFVYEKLGSAYSYDQENDEILFYPLKKDGTFDSEDGGVVQNWEDCEEDKDIIKRALKLK